VEQFPPRWSSTPDQPPTGSNISLLKAILFCCQKEKHEAKFSYFQDHPKKFCRCEYEESLEYHHMGMPLTFWPFSCR